ncbi:MAG: hypothetical protein ACKOQV_02880 [Betaproteobacteria bacterium]
MNVIQITEPTSLAPLLSFSDPEKGNLTSSQALTESILDAFPSGSYAMTGLLRLMDIVATTSV